MNELEIKNKKLKFILELILQKDFKKRPSAKEIYDYLVNPEKEFINLKKILSIRKW